MALTSRAAGGTVKVNDAMASRSTDQESHCALHELICVSCHEHCDAWSEVKCILQ